VVQQPTATPGPTATDSPSASASPGASDSGFTSFSPSPDASFPNNVGPSPGVQLAGNDQQNFVAAQHIVGYYQDVAINGKTALTAFRTSYSCCDSHPYEAYVDLNLSRAYKKLTGRFGVEDHAKANESVHVRVYADNRLLYDKAFALGQSEDVTLDVTGVLRLRFDFVGPFADVPTAIGDPTVFP
jgi:hypothetical protein